MALSGQSHLGTMRRLLLWAWPLHVSLEVTAFWTAIRRVSNAGALMHRTQIVAFLCPCSLAIVGFSGLLVVLGLSTVPKSMLP